MKKKRFLSMLLVVLLVLSCLPGDLGRKTGVVGKVKAEEATLQNPRIEPDENLDAGQKVTYDCVWFGSYPQTEIVDQASTSGVYGKAWAESTDYEENPSLYSELQNASGWDSNGDIEISGTKYRRIESWDATIHTNTSSSVNFYHWSSTVTYHYFRYEPIKWRILNVSDTKTFLLADKALDDQRYNTSQVDITWNTSTIRSWLNGYGSWVNSYGTDYTSKNFINSAFNSSERSVIESTHLDNKTTGPYSENYGGDNTTDKIFLLS